MSPPPQAPNAPSSDDDALLQRYREANELDTARPGVALRETVLAHARSQLGATPEPLRHASPAANDSQWKLRALGSLAVVGLIGLLVMQFERGTPEEQVLALGQPEQRAERAAKAQTPEKAGPSSGAPAASAAGDAPETTQSPITMEREPEPQPAPPTPALAESTSPAGPSGRDAGQASSSPPPNEQPSSAQADAAMEAAPRRRALPPPAPAARSMPEAFSQSAPLVDQNADAQAPPPQPPMAASPAPTEKQESRLRRSLPLHDAVVSGQKAKLQQLLKQGVDINARDGDGRTALMLAALGSDPVLVELLMKAGADPDLRDRAGWRAVDLAEQAGHTDWLPLFTHPKR
ncbi:MAG TPA: ankyrin repeat domain-containing protein [Hydrogenophaga sp.]